jgi:hypothetical protein
MPPLGAGHAHGIALDTRYQSGPLELRANLGAATSERGTGPLEFALGGLRSRWLAVGVARRWGDLASIRLMTSLASGSPTSVVWGQMDWQSPGGWGGSGEIAGSPERILGPLNGARLPTYSRTDLSFVRHWPVAVGSDGRLTTTLMITNLFNQQNSLGYVAATNLQPRRVLLFSARSLIMQVGWRF